MSPAAPTFLKLSQRPAVQRAVVYVALTYLVSWALMAPVIFHKQSPVFLNLGGGPAIIAILMAANGRVESHAARIKSFLLSVPLLWLILVVATSWLAVQRGPLEWNPRLLIPALVPAWIISGMWSGDRGVRNLMRALVGRGKWHWLLGAFLFFPIFLPASGAVARFIHLPVVHPAPGATWFGLAVLCGVRFVHALTITSVFEEPGWRGYLLPTLQERFSPLAASVLIWLVWAAWHAPLDFSGGIGSNLALWVEVRLVYFIPITILLTWFYNRSGGWASGAVFHAAMNVFPFLLPYSPPMMGLIFLWAAYVVVSNRMWRHREAATQPATGVALAS